MVTHLMRLVLIYHMQETVILDLIPFYLLILVLFYVNSHEILGSILSKLMSFLEKYMILPLLIILLNIK